MKSVTEFSPAKINLFLAVTGRRADGFHDLVSVVALLDFGDELGIEARGRGEGGRRQATGDRGEESGVRGQEAGGGRQGTDMGLETHATSSTGQGTDMGRETHATFTLECDDPAVPVDRSNLVVRAAEAFRQAQAGAVRQAQAGAEGAMRLGRSIEDETELVPPGTVHFRLKKRIPLGAGLGGGSSNGVAALRALNALGPARLGEAELERLAAGLGSDCVVFLRRGPLIMRGRGERVASLPESAALRLRGRRVLLFKPAFGVATAWAYGRLAQRGRDYVAAPEAEARLAMWVNGQGPAEELLFNNLEPVAFEKHPALPLLLARLRREFGVAAGMSGSGSACFALLPGEAADDVLARMTQRIRECWGPAAWIQPARIT